MVQKSAKKIIFSDFTKIKFINRKAINDFTNFAIQTYIFFVVDSGTRCKTILMQFS